MIKDHSCLSDRERESKESFRFLLVREFERITHQLSTRKALLIIMEGLRQRSEVLKQKCERVQEVLLEMKTRTKIYYENQCKSTTDPTLLVPHWYQSSSAEYATMLRIHKKETFDYACINKALQKIKEAERQMNILESFLIFLTSLQSTRSTGWVIHGHRGRIRHFQQHLQDPI